MKRLSIPCSRVTVGVDSHWSWVVCLASFLIQFIVVGIQNSFGTFFVEFLKEFDRGESSTAWIGSVSFGLTFMNGPLATALCVRWGSRVVACLGAALSCSGLIMTSFVTSFPWLYVTYGIVFGLGSSFCYFASIAGLTLYFKKRLCLAYGISLAGSGAGTPVMIMGLEYIITKYGWRTTSQIAAAVFTIVFLSGLTYLPVGWPKEKRQVTKDSIHAVSKQSVSSCSKAPTRRCYVLRKLSLLFDPEPFKDRAFTIWVIALGFVIFGYFIPFVFVIRMAKDIGVSRSESTLLIAYLTITQTFSKILFGRVGDFARKKRIIILQVILFVQAIVTMLCPLATKYPDYGYAVLLVYVVVFGFSDGCWSVMIGMGTELIVGKAMMPRAFGSLYGLISIPLILGPPVAGMVFDKYGTYDAAFVLAGGTVLLGIVLMVMVQRMIHGKPCRDEKVQKTIEVRVDLCSDDHGDTGDLDNVISTSSTGLDKQYLVPWRRRVLDTEHFSRPSSLIISRLLDDAQSVDGIHSSQPHIEDFTIRRSVDCFPVVMKMKDENALRESTVTTQDAGEKQAIDMESHGRDSLLKRETSESFNSDSGRSTGSEGTESMASFCARLSSVDSDFEEDTSRSTSTPNISTENKDDNKRVHSYSNFFFPEKAKDSDDIFSNLMEKALEVEATYCGFELFCQTREIHLVEGWHEKLHSYRETVL